MTEKLISFPAFPRPRVTVTLWPSPGKPDLELLRSQLADDGYQVVKWASEPHQVYLAHAHIYTELLWLIAGSLTVALPAEKRLLELDPGDRVEVPAGIVHGSQAGPEGATYLVATR